MKKLIHFALVSILALSAASCDLISPETAPEPYTPRYAKTFKAIDLGLSVKWAACNLGALNGESIHLYSGDMLLEPTV